MLMFTLLWAALWSKKKIAQKKKIIAYGRIFDMMCLRQENNSYHYI